MKKYVAYVFLSLVFGFCLFFAYKYYVESPGNPSEKAMKNQGLITSLEEFVLLIKFHDGEGVTMLEADGFDYELPTDSNIHQFIPSKFYAKNKGKERVLREKIKYFLSTRKLGGTVRTLKIEELPDILQVHNQLHTTNADGENTFKEIRDKLEDQLSRATITADGMTELGYIYTLEGDYEKTSVLDARNCRKNKARCKKDVEISVEGRVLDNKKRGIGDASIFVLNYPNLKPFKANSQGQFSFKVKTKYPEKIRIRVAKESYASAYNDFYVLTGGGTQKKDLRFVLHRSDGSVIINTKSPQTSIKEAGEEVKGIKFEKGIFTLKTTSSVYKIPQNAIVDKNGKVFRGRVNVYVYEFDKVDNPENLLRVDFRSSSEDKIWIGESLITFGMPYLQFFDTDTGEELFVDRSNPIQMQVRIREWEAVRNGDPELGVEGLTELDLEALVKESNRSKEGITRTYLLKKKWYLFPTWWMLDQKRGIWDTAPFKLLDTTGLIEAPYYSIDLKKNKTRKRR